MNVIDRQTHNKANVMYNIWTKQKIKGKMEHK